MADTIFNKTADSTLDVYKPAKVLQISFTSATGYKNWTHNDGEGDPWWSGGGSAKPYQYTITFTVTEYSHGSHKTRETRKYNGMDVSVGDWIAGSQDGKCLQIVSVTSKSKNQPIWTALAQIGRRIQECKVGIIGAGKIGFRVATELEKIGTKSILLCDLEQNTSLTNHPSMKWADINEVINSCDVLTFHLPLTSKTENLISEKELLMMKKDAVIVNTSRGGIINEDDLYKVLESGHLFGVALDVFRKEPYSGKLIDIDRCLLTAHTASMTIDCRNYMEIEAVKEVIRHLNGESLKCEIPAI